VRGWVILAVVFLLGVWFSPQVKAWWAKARG
jgi:hypothetical protein